MAVLHVGVPFSMISDVHDVHVDGPRVGVVTERVGTHVHVTEDFYTPN